MAPGKGYLKVSGGLDAPTGQAIDWTAQAELGYHITQSQKLFANVGAGTGGYSATAGYEWDW